jgi:phage tail-like protein
MAGENPEVYPTSFFKLSIGGVEAAGLFRECSGLDSESEAVESRSVKDGKQFIRKVPGQVKWSDITLKRGVDPKADLWTWRKKVIDGNVKDARVDGTIELISQVGESIATYSFIQGWPRKYTGASFDPKANDVAVEEIVICHEGFERK